MHAITVLHQDFVLCEAGALNCFKAVQFDYVEADRSTKWNGVLRTASRRTLCAATAAVAAPVSPLPWLLLPKLPQLLYHVYDYCLCKLWQFCCTCRCAGC
jgi:hypothetical protein